MTIPELFRKLSTDEADKLTSALADVLTHGFGEVHIRIQDNKIVFAQGVKNYK